MKIISLSYPIIKFRRFLVEPWNELPTFGRWILCLIVMRCHDGLRHLRHDPFLLEEPTGMGRPESWSNDFDDKEHTSRSHKYSCEKPAAPTSITSCNIWHILKLPSNTVLLVVYEDLKVYLKTSFFFTMWRHRGSATQELCLQNHPKNPAGNHWWEIMGNRILPACDARCDSLPTRSGCPACWAHHTRRWNTSKIKETGGWLGGWSCKSSPLSTSPENKHGT